MSLTQKEQTKIYYPRGYDKGSKLPPMSVQDLQFHYPDMFRRVLAIGFHWNCDLTLHHY